VGKPESARALTGEVADMASGTTFLTVAEVAAQMRVSKMTVYRLVHSGELEAVRVGRSFRVPVHAVEEFLGKSYFQAG
jgi:excisionase family DNA binding protein